MTEGFFLSDVSKADYRQLIDVWEASVRATHHFLTENDIVFFRELIFEKYFDLVQLKSVRNASGAITGFIGTSPGKIEMLFIHPASRGKGMGKFLVDYAVNQLAVHKVDVNEQNTQAVGFYYALGFGLVKRSPLDGMGKPYPILHLELRNSSTGII